MDVISHNRNSVRFFRILPVIIVLMIIISNNDFCCFGQAPENSGDIVIANDDLIVTYKMHPFEANIINNDYGLSEGISSLKIFLDPEYGKAEPTNRNTIIYTPDRYYIGTDYFEYQICNSSGNCDVAAVFVEVMEYDFHPIANNDTISVFQESYSTIDVLKNDQFIYDIPISLNIISDLQNGRATVINNEISIVIERYYIGTDTLEYEVCDRDGDCDRAYLFVILADDEKEFFIPQGFSPDGDGINDTFTVPEFDYLSPVASKASAARVRGPTTPSASNPRAR